MPIEKKKCEHPACTCYVSEKESYCSQYCEDAGEDEIEISCDCGHPGCELAEEAALS